MHRLRHRTWTAEQTCTRLADDVITRVDANQHKLNNELKLSVSLSFPDSASVALSSLFSVLCFVCVLAFPSLISFVVLACCVGCVGCVGCVADVLVVRIMYSAQI